MDNLEDKILKSQTEVENHKNYWNYIHEITSIVQGEEITYRVGEKNFAKKAFEEGAQAPNSEFYVNRVFGEEGAGYSLLISEGFDEDLWDYVAFWEVKERESYILDKKEKRPFETNILDTCKYMLDIIPEDKKERFIRQEYEQYVAAEHLMDDVNMDDFIKTKNYLKDLIDQYEQ